MSDSNCIVLNVIKEAKLCKHCKNPVVLFNGEWWHVSTYGEFGEPSISLRKRQDVSVETKECGSCGHKEDVWEVCVNPEG